MNRFFRKLWTASPEKVFAKVVRKSLHSRREFVGDELFRLSATDAERVSSAPRYQPLTVQLQGNDFRIVDSHSFTRMVEEISINGAYEFEARNAQPLIVDCGANVGVSIVYLKALYPSAKIVGYEADSYVFAALEHNVASMGLKDVEVKNAAVWHREDKLKFYSEGSWGGRLTSLGPYVGDIVEVKAVRLRDELTKLLEGNERIDFLKIDIEGAEEEVLPDIASLLDRVDNLFFEYHSFKKRPQKLGSFLEVLSEVGFRYYIKEASTLRSPLVNTLSGEMDLQLDISARRIQA